MKWVPSRKGVGPGGKQVNCKEKCCELEFFAYTANKKIRELGVQIDTNMCKVKSGKGGQKTLSSLRRRMFALDCSATE